MRLAVISVARAPYWEHLYQALSRRTGIRLRVFYLQPQDSVRGWSNAASGYDAVRLPCLTPERLYPIPVVGVINPGAIAHLERFGPDCILVHGYSYLTHLQTIRWAVRSHVPYLMWGDSTTHKLGANGVAPLVKRWWLRYVCRHAAGALVIGSLNEAFWAHYGVEAGRRFRAPLTVDNGFFAAEADRWRARKQSQRESLGLPAGRLVLYIGRFAPEKNLETLLRAVALSGHSGARLSIALIGQGPERARIDRVVRELGLRNVYLFGFQKQVDLPRFYGLGDALVLPSREEAWGLVVNEAMASGLPILLSRSVGCAPDLLEDGVNGFGFEANDERALASCLERFSRLDDSELQRMGGRSAEKISNWTQAHTLSGISLALEAARSKPANNALATVSAP